MPTQVLQCPFCDTTSSRGTGLSAHIRGRHPKEYAKWIKDPNRIQAAQKPGSPKKAAQQPDRVVSGPVVCPDCGKTFKTLAALGGHRAYLHKTLKKTAATVKPQIPAPMKSAASRPALNSAHEHLRAAREALVGRDQQIEGELKRLAELQAEKERVQHELGAVNAALQVFGDKV